MRHQVLLIVVMRQSIVVRKLGDICCVFELIVVRLLKGVLSWNKWLWSRISSLLFLHCKLSERKEFIRITKVVELLCERRHARFVCKVAIISYLSFVAGILSTLDVYLSSLGLRLAVNVPILVDDFTLTVVEIHLRHRTFNLEHVQSNCGILRCLVDRYGPITV